MKTTQTLLTALIFLLSITISQSQSEDVGLSSAQNTPAPYLTDEAGTISFIFSADNGVTLIPGEVLKITFSLANLDDVGVPYGDPIVDEFDWSFLFGSWVGILDHDLPIFSGGEIKLDVIAVGESPIDDPQHGFNANIVPHAEDPPMDSNDEINAYTYAYIAILPVNLSTFVAKTNSCESIELNWTTESEINNKGFYIQRSVGNTSRFEDIAFVDGNFNSNESINYSFTDKDVSRLSGETVYYRLNQVDLDGTSEHSKTVGVSYDCTRNLNINIYPNPVVNELQIDVTGDRSEIQAIQLTNNLGQVVKDFTSEFLTSDILDLSDITPGVYYIKIIDAEGSTLTVEQILKLQN